MPHWQVTLRDVAREAGVHPATASRALNPDKRTLVNPETVERVLLVAQRLGYVADPIAQALRGGTSQQVGVLVRTLEHPWGGSLLHGIDTELGKAGYTPWITYTGDDPERVRRVVGQMTAWRAGGLIIATARVPDKVVTEAAETGLPVVTVARPAPDQVCSAVRADNEGGTRAAIGHLFKLGHTRIAYIAGPQDIPVHQARLRGCREAIEDSGIRPDWRLVRVAGDDTIAGGEACCRELLADGRRITAVAAGNDYLAVGCYAALRAKGLRIPEDVSVIGFDNVPLTGQLSPALSTVHFPGYEMGVEAAELIVAQMRGESAPIRTVLLAANIITRDSTTQCRDLRHAGVEKYLRPGLYLGHNDVVKSAGEPGCGSYDGAAGSRSERGTRGQVARLILELGPSTAATLGSRLGLTPAAIRRHLDNLIAGGMVETRTARTYGNRGRGRPAKVFVITDAGRSAFEHTYDDLATSALRYIAETAGTDAVAEFARRQVADLERRYAPVVAGEDLKHRVQALAEALSVDGYAASSGPSPMAGGEQLCQHHCPVAHVAAEFPQLCEAETEAFGRLLGTPVQRLATIAHGDGICTTHVTDKALLAGKPAGPQAVEIRTGHDTEESGTS
jgi:DNA-binding LacI/PurR family transcriptional regulator/predicted ArsR family transcriptional regulator